MRYELRLVTTAAGVGYFACHPLKMASFDENLAYLRARPLDEFMHKYLLDMVGGLEEETVRQILEVARDRDPLVVALVCEAAHSFERLSALRTCFERQRMIALLPYTPLIIIKSVLLDDRKLHNDWTSFFEANLSEHRLLPPPESAGLPLLHAADHVERGPLGGAHHNIAQVLEWMEELGKAHYKEENEKEQGKEENKEDVKERDRRYAPERGDSARASTVSAGETARHALERLREMDVFAGDETTHTSSLSPYGFLRKWRLNVSVRNGRHDYSVMGIQTSYGKGLTPEAARASYAMEMVERVSSFAGFGPEGVLGYARQYPLVRATFTELGKTGKDCLDPNDLRLEVPYGDEPLYWMEAEERYNSDDTSDIGSGLSPRLTPKLRSNLRPKLSLDLGSNLGPNLRPKLIPAQSVFLFCNLDEVGLFSGLGSTGLASGNTMEQAKVSALLEVIERDCEATTLYEPSRCFKVEAEDPKLESLLSNFKASGVRIQFQDLTSAMGVPCFKCFVVDARGGIIKGTGAHLDGKKALVSALTETPFAFPDAGPSADGPEGLPTVRFEDLPDYSTGDHSRDLEVLEALLMVSGFRPLYVDLTRKDLRIPVVKAIIPGMELMADFDRFSRVSPRLYANYLKSSARP